MKLKYNEDRKKEDTRMKMFPVDERYKHQKGSDSRNLASKIIMTDTNLYLCLVIAAFSTSELCFGQVGLV